MAPFFSPAELIDDLVYVLTTGGLLHASEELQFRTAGDHVTAFAVSMMHGVEITLEDGFTAELVGHCGDGLPIQVWAAIPLEVDGRTNTFHVPAFFTEIDPRKQCSPALAKEKIWGAPVEMLDGGALDFVR